MFEIVFLIAVILYSIQSFIFTIGIKKKYAKISDDKLPAITIIVAARDEEDNIYDCLKSLDDLIYPENKIEIIIVDDHSTDRTGEIINEFISDRPRFQSIKPGKQIGSVRGKANAIANAIQIAKGEIIITTDADCSVSPTWAKTIASYFCDDVAIVCGYTNQDEYNNFAAMQSVDWIYLLGVAAGTMNLGKPLSCIGNNMAYRKSVYEEIGGYEKIPFSVTEDFKLLMTIHKLKKYKIIYPLDNGALIKSKPCPDLKSLYLQKKRWGVGGLDSELAGFAVMTSAFVTHIAVVLTPFLFSTTAVILVLFKLFVDYFFLYHIYRRLQLKLKLIHFLTYEIYFIIYVILLPIQLVVYRKVKWKGRKY